MQQAILERFGSNIRAQEAHAKLLTISQGKRSVRDYTSEFEMLLGRLSTRDEATWKKCTCGVCNRIWLKQLH